MAHTSAPTRLAFLIALCTVPFWAYADIYRYTDAEGRIVYTNVPPKSLNKKSMKVITEHNISVIPSRPMRAMLPAPSLNNDKDGATHRNTASTEASLTRRSILLEELNSEVKALADARKQHQLQIAQSLTNSTTERGEQPPNTSQQDIQSHERNINALQRELGVGIR